MSRRRNGLRGEKKKKDEKKTEGGERREVRPPPPPARSLGPGAWQREGGGKGKRLEEKFFLRANGREETASEVLN